MRAFLGTGWIGAGLAEAACKRGDDVVVWNRTASKAEALREHGARVATSAAEAVRGAARVHIALTSDPAVDQVLDAITDALDRDAIVIDHSTNSPEKTRARAKRLAGKVRYLHVPVFMSPVACREAKGIMLVAGPEGLFGQVSGELEKMTGKVLYLGEEPGRAAAFKLSGNGMLLAMLGGLADVMTLADQQGLTPDDVLGLFEHLDVRMAMTRRGPKMAAADWDTLWSLRMARKDLGLMLDAAEGRPLGILPGLGARMDALIERGEGEKDVAVLAVDVKKDGSNV